jgi:hypothetical protein
MGGNEEHQIHKIKNYSLMENNFHKQVNRLKIQQFNKYREVFYNLLWQINIYRIFIISCDALQCQLLGLITQSTHTVQYISMLEDTHEDMLLPTGMLFTVFISKV